MGIRTALKRIERAEKALKNAACANPSAFKPIFRSEKTRRLRNIGRQVFDAEVQAIAATWNANE
jgi:hypothetical protein